MKHLLDRVGGVSRRLLDSGTPSATALAMPPSSSLAISAVGALRAAALLLLVAACAEPGRAEPGHSALPPTDPDAIPEAHFDAPALRAQFLEATGWLRAPALDASPGPRRPV